MSTKNSNFMFMEYFQKSQSGNSKVSIENTKETENQKSDKNVNEWSAVHKSGMKRRG